MSSYSKGRLRRYPAAKESARRIRKKKLDQIGSLSSYNYRALNLRGYSNYLDSPYDYHHPGFRERASNVVTTKFSRDYDYSDYPNDYSDRRVGRGRDGSVNYSHLPG